MSIVESRKKYTDSGGQSTFHNRHSKVFQNFQFPTATVPGVFLFLRYASAYERFNQPLVCIHSAARAGQVVTACCDGRMP